MDVGDQARMLERKRKSVLAILGLVSSLILFISTIKRYLSSLHVFFSCSFGLFCTRSQTATRSIKSLFAAKASMCFFVPILPHPIRAARSFFILSLLYVGVWGLGSQGMAELLILRSNYFIFLDSFY